mmetsp:Transcript_26459/g.57496  ORF Transcript_26459/g.57496 Transcript_26459/m.57496 type:complete len:305 (-) Transcript_26459:639-1553(-)
MVYLPSAHCRPCPKRPAYGRTASPAGHSSATAAYLAKKVASRAPTELPLRELKPVAWKACAEAMHCCRCCSPSAFLRSGGAGARPAPTRASSASTSSRAASGSDDRNSLRGGMIGGEHCWRWNRMSSVMANEFSVPLVGSLMLDALAQHLTSRMSPMKRVSMVLMWRSAWLLKTPSLLTHMSQCTPVMASTNFTRGTLACGMRCTSRCPFWRSRLASLRRSFTFDCLYCISSRFRADLDCVDWSWLNLNANGENGATCSDMSTSLPQLWIPEANEPNGATVTPLILFWTSLSMRAKTPWSTSSY